MKDPITDKEAAEAFTKENKYQHGRSWGANVAVAPKYLGNQWGKKEGEPRCWGEVSHYDRITSWCQCDKPGKVRLADGSTWCGIHSPEAVAKREHKRQENFKATQAMWAAKAAKWKRENMEKEAFPKFLEALRQIERGHNDPRALAREVLKDFGD